MAEICISQNASCIQGNSFVSLTQVGDWLMWPLGGRWQLRYIANCSILNHVIVGKHCAMCKYSSMPAIFFFTWESLTHNIFIIFFNALMVGNPVNLSCEWQKILHFIVLQKWQCPLNSQFTLSLTILMDNNLLDAQECHLCGIVHFVITSIIANNANVINSWRRLVSVFQAIPTLRGSWISHFEYLMMAKSGMMSCLFRCIHWEHFIFFRPLICRWKHPPQVFLLVWFCSL